MGDGRAVVTGRRLNKELVDLALHVFDRDSTTLGDATLGDAGCSGLRGGCLRWAKELVLRMSSEGAGALESLWGA
jgi:hypothetical protein